MNNDTIGDFLKAVEAATIDETDVYAKRPGGVRGGRAHSPRTGSS